MSFIRPGRASIVIAAQSGGGSHTLEDWLSRSTSLGVIRALRFDSSANVNAFRFSSGIGHDPTPTGGSTGANVRHNATDGLLGDGCLELEQLTNENMNSYLWLPFDPNYATWQNTEAGLNMGPGQEFYVQVSVKSNCGGDSGTGGGGRKVFSVTRLTNSYTFNELVVEDTLYRGIVQMYQGMGPGSVAYSPFISSEAGGDFNLQPGSEFPTSGFCSYQAGGYESQAACFNFQEGEWVTYLLHVIPSDDGVSNGTLELSAWVDGMSDYVKIINQTSIPMFYDADKPDGYNAFIAWIYETGRTAGPANQKQWYDQIIVSRDYIPRPNAPQGLPSWYTSQATSEWASLTGGAADTLADVDPCSADNCSYTSVEGQDAVMNDWCGSAASPSSLIIAAQGGHLGYAGNELYEFDINTASPRWYRRIDPSTSVQTEVGYYSDGKPTSRHGYKHDCYIGPGVNGNRWFSHHASAVYGNGGTHLGDVASWALGSSSYDAESTFPDYTGVTAYDNFCAYDQGAHKVWVQEGPGAQADWTLHALDVAAKTWAAHGNSGALQDGEYMAAFVDPIRRVLVGQSGDQLYIRDLATPSATGRAYTVTGLTGNAIAYEPRGRKWVHWDGGKNLRVITPPSDYRTGDGSVANGLNASASYTVGQTISPSGGATPTSANSNGTYGRFSLIQKPYGIIVVNAITQACYFFKLPSEGL